jgi:hypothetical protein
MAKKTMDFDVVREIALALPDVEESTIHGAPSLKLRGKLLTCPAIHRSAEPNTLAIRIDFDQREVDGGQTERLLPDRSLRELSDGAGATVSDRPELFKEFVGPGMALREFTNEEKRTQSWQPASKGDGTTRIFSLTNR